MIQILLGVLLVVVGAFIYLQFGQSGKASDGVAQESSAGDKSDLEKEKQDAEAAKAREQ